MFAYCLLAVAIAHESETQDVIIDETVPLFQNQGLDSGWVPSNGAISLRLEILANGEADVQMDGNGQLEWPENLDLTLDGESDAASVTLNNSLDSTVSLKFDIGGYQFEQPIVSRSLSFGGSTVFTPFSLSETQTILSLYEGDPVLTFNQKVLFVVDVIFNGTINPTCSTTFTGLHWDAGGQQLFTDNEGSFVPVAGAQSFDSQAIYNAQIDTDCTIDFVPSVSVCVPLFDCVEWEVGTFPLDNLTSQVTHAFAPNALSFPLPVAEVTSELNFGDVEVGASSTIELDVSNPGLLLLEGTATTDDSSGFSALGAEIYIPGGGTDSIVLTFSSEQEGAVSSTLYLETNDPAHPTQEISLIANVLSEDDFNELGGEGGKIEEGCGCSASTNSSPRLLGLWLLIPGLMVLRRREIIR